MPVFLPEEPMFGGSNPMGGVGTPPIAPEQGPGMIDRLRQSNIFNPQQQGAPGAYDPNMYMNQGAPEPMESQTPAYDALAGLMGERPELEEPGMLKKIAASMIALNDPRLAMQLLNQPDQELVDWEQQVGHREKQAELESRAQARQATTETAGRRATTAEERLDFDREKFEAELTPADKQLLKLAEIDYRSERVLEQISARAVAARETGDLRQADTLEAIAARAKEARTTAGTRGEESRETATHREELVRGRPAKTTGATQLERGRRIDQNIREYIDRNPEDKEKWFTLDPKTDEWTINAAELAGMGFPGTGPGKEERSSTYEADKMKRDDILEAIYGGGTQTLEPTAQATETPADPGVGETTIAADGRELEWDGMGWIDPNEGQ